MLTSMNTADARDAEERRGAQDAPPEERRPLAASARLAAAISGSAESHASAQAHDAAPVFAVPTAAASTASPSTANVEAPRETASAPHVDPQNVDRLVQSMHVNAKAGIMEATVRLRPEYLGEVTIHLRVDGTGVSAIVRAESAGVRQWLESQEESIRGGLAQHGLELGRFIVDPDDRQQAQQDAQQEAAEQRRAFARRRQAAMAQRFEVTA
jgi:flagellar hook-length control protein FliK